MGDHYKNITIAVFVLAAIFIVTFLMLFIHPSVGDEKKILYVRFPDIDKVTLGTRVTYGGKPVGEVVGIKEVSGEKDYRVTHDGIIYPYELELKIDSSIHIFNTDELSLRTSGLLGEKSVAITPLPPKPAQKVRTVENEVLYATETGSVEQTFKEFRDVASKFDDALDNINRILDELEHEHTFKSIARTASNLADISDSLNKPKEISDIIANMHKLSTMLQDVTQNIRDITAAVNQPESLTNAVANITTLSDRVLDSWDTVDIALNDLAATSANARNIAKSLDKPKEIQRIFNNIDSFTIKLNSNQGFIGKIFSDDDLYLRVVALLNKGEVIFDDINHYGLLFHLDKGWQRLRARRMNLLAKLCSPQEFRNYFNDEIDNISTSLERVSMVIDRNSELYPCGLLLDDNEFAKVYAELLRRVSAMEESLKMYNQQLVDEQLPRTELIVAPCCR